jgi:hypothetical protein
MILKTRGNASGRARQWFWEGERPREPFLGVGGRQAQHPTRQRWNSQLPSRAVLGPVNWRESGPAAQGAFSGRRAL